MLKFIRILLVTAFAAALLGAAGLYFYTYSHRDVSKPAFRVDEPVLEISVTADRSELLRGLYAFDNVDGNITDRIIIRSISRFTDDQAAFRVTYIVFDEASNYETCTRTVRYTDYEPPKFHLSKPMVFGVGETVTFMDRISVTDSIDGDISGRMVLSESTVNHSTPGTYTARITVTNRMGDSAELPLKVMIVNPSPSAPVITLRDHLIYLEQGAKPNLPEYVAAVTDPLEEEPVSTRLVKVNRSELDTSTPGVYEVYYYYTGASGETATAILTVVVE